MIAVTVASEALLAKLEENRDAPREARRPAHDRARRRGGREARRAVGPVYYITGTIHSPETGAPTALMELAYRLAVDESPYIRFIRDHVDHADHAVVEVDGRDRHGGRLRLAPRAPGPELAAARLLGALRRARQQPRRHGADAALTRNVLDDLPRREGPGAARPARVGALSSTTTRSATAPTTPGSIRS